MCRSDLLCMRVWPCWWKSGTFFVCVCQGDHATVSKELERAALPHLCHGSGGVPVFRRSCVWLGFIGVCPQVRELLQLSVCQHNRRQRNPGLRWVSPPHIYPSWVAERCPASQKRFQKQFAALPWLIFLVCVSDCSRQDEQFSLVFTIASFMNNFMTLLSGFLFDHFGTMVTRFCAVWVQLPNNRKLTERSMLMSAFKKKSRFHRKKNSRKSCLFGHNRDCCWNQCIGFFPSITKRKLKWFLNIWISEAFKEVEFKPAFLLPNWIIFVTCDSVILNIDSKHKKIL